jgi:poly-gamma-glutamate synthesis protein (capsule biosynthesis protein)
MKIALLGDVMLGRLVNERLLTETPEYPWGDTLPILKSMDVRIANLECVISDIGTPWSLTPKMFHFRSDAKNVESLIAAHMDIVSLANNHVLDYQEEALACMLKLLDANHICHAGAGKTLDEAMQPALVEFAGKTIGCIAVTDNEEEWAAGKSRAGIFYVPIDVEDRRAKALFQQVENVRKRVDLLVVSLHWGPNWGYEVPSEQIPFARTLIDRGADIVFGHSGHVFRGIEIYRGKPIFYCAGDFIDDYMVDERERNDESFIFVVDDMKRIDLYPTVITDFQARLAPPDRQKEILVKMKHLCEQLGTPCSVQENIGCIEIG